MVQVDFTQELRDHAAGGRDATARLMSQVYQRLRALAGAYMRGERPDHSLQPTALVHEAYLRLVDITRIDWRGKSHFFAMAARQMRRILVEHARRHGAAKRGGGIREVTLDEDVGLDSGPRIEILALHEALEQLSRLHPRQAEVAALRFFGGLQWKEVGLVLGVSERTVRGDWRVARAWLARQLDPGPTG